jgi:hypothetical protein
VSSRPDYSILVQNTEYTITEYEVNCEAIYRKYESRIDFHQCKDAEDKSQTGYKKSNVDTLNT